jgi:hypothetical protein
MTGTGNLDEEKFSRVHEVRYVSTFCCQADGKTDLSVPSY